jgi:ABC-type nitrate/sulfonate/bicarbonate transport system substrate-binding protein
MLVHSGVDVKKVTFIQTGNTTVSMIGLQQGWLEASVLSPPFTGEMVVQGFTVLAKTGDAVEAPFNGMATSAEKLRARPERIRKAVKAMLESSRRIKQERSAVIDYIRQSFKVSDKIAENSYNEIREVMFDDLIMPEEKVRKSLDGYFRGENDKSIAVGDVVDYSILRSLR